jgi:hypothetical protein
MNRAAACGLLLIGLTTTAIAGQVYGILFQNNQPLTGAPVRLNCGNESANGVTDSQGVYRVFVRASGGCTLVLEPEGRKAEGSVYSYDRPTAYDFDVVNQGGRWVLIPRKK